LSACGSRSCGIIALAASLTLAACGGSDPRQDAGEPHADFRVAVTTARFPASQRLAQRTDLVIAVRNAGRQTIPDVAVTICNVTCAYPAPPGEGSSAEAFSANLPPQPGLANTSRAVWIINRSPGPCAYNCRAGGAGGAVTAYSNTWALGRLAPGATARFQWAVTAVQAGRHVVAWQVAAGLDGNARAVLADGSQPRGTFAVEIGSAPPRYYVKPDGTVVTVG
jgi:hypothetical protein